MHKLGVLAGAAALATVGVVGAAHAVPVYVVHGAPGKDLGQQTNALPVDIAVNGACSDFQDVPYRTVGGPVDLPAGSYEISVSLAQDGVDPCAGPLAFNGRVDVSLAETAIIIAHLDANGAPRISKFTTNTAPIDDDNGRVTVYHTAAAPKVDLRVKQASSGDVIATIKGLTNGEASFPALLPPDSYIARVSPSTDSGVGFNASVADVPFDVEAGNSYSLFAVGSLENDTFRIIPVVVEPTS